MSCAWAGAYARVWNRNWRRVDASNPYTSVCLCVCRLMAISLLVNMKNACKADFFSRFFAAIVWRTEAKRTRRQCCQRSQQETLNLKSSEMFLNSGWWDDEKIMCVFVPFLGRYNLLADGSRKRAMMSSRVCVCVNKLVHWAVRSSLWGRALSSLLSPLVALKEVQQLNVCFPEWVVWL